MKSVDQIKEELKDLYVHEQEEAQFRVDRDRATRINIALKLLDGVETRSDLMSFLSADKGAMLFPVGDAEALGRVLRAGFAEEELNQVGIYLDKQPAEMGEHCAGAVLINTTPNRYHCSVDFDGSVTFLGKWMVDVRQAEVFALAGVHANARGSLAVVDVQSMDASAVRLPGTYYQKIEKFNDLYSFSQLERRFQTENVYSILDAVKEKVGFTDGLSLLETTATPALERGDQVIASDKWFTLVRNELSRSYHMFQHRSEDQVVRAIYASQHDCIISDDLLPLKAALVRDEFLRMPGERLVLGKNQQGEIASLKFDMSYFAFLPENLYKKEQFGRWEPYSYLIPLSQELTLNAQIVSIKCKFEDCLKAGQELEQTKTTGLKR